MYLYRVGDRSLGTYTAVGGTDVWMRQFDIDVEGIGQWESVASRSR